MLDYGQGSVPRQPGLPGCDVCQGTVQPFGVPAGSACIGVLLPGAVLLPSFCPNHRNFISIALCVSKLLWLFKSHFDLCVSPQVKHRINIRIKIQDHNKFFAKKWTVLPVLPMLFFSPVCRMYFMHSRSDAAAQKKNPIINSETFR